MLAGTHHFACDQGSTWTRTVSVYGPASVGASVGASVSLAGYTARMQVRRDHDEPNYYVELTTENDRISISGNTITLSLAASATAAMSRGGVYDLEILQGGTTPYRLLEGEFRLNPEVTR